MPWALRQRSRQPPALSIIAVLAFPRSPRRSDGGHRTYLQVPRGLYFEPGHPIVPEFHRRVIQLTVRSQHSPGRAFGNQTP